MCITGDRGSLGRNLAANLNERKDCKTTDCWSERNRSETSGISCLRQTLSSTWPGVNRPPRSDPNFNEVNTDSRSSYATAARQQGRSPKIVFSSSTQAALDNPYGVSKAKAREGASLQFAARPEPAFASTARSNFFGKWCRPNYNSVTATFCHNIANDLPIADI